MAGLIRWRTMRQGSRWGKCMRSLVLLLVIPMAFAPLEAGSYWTSTGFTVIGPSSANELEADGASFVIGRPSEMNATGILTFAAPGASPTTLQPEQAGQGAQFGHRIAVSGDLMVVTEARRNTQFPAASGFVNFYERTAGPWLRTYATGSPYEPSMEHEFGDALAVAEDRVFIGAPGYLTQRGVVWVYERTGAGTWPLYPTGSVFAFDGASFDDFGSAIAAEGDWLAVGAPLMERDASAEGEGAVYLYRRIDGVYVQIQRLMAPNPQNGAGFGHSIDIGDGTLVVGASSEDDPLAGIDAGAAYVFSLVAGRWELQQRLVAGDGAASDSFGDGVAIRGGTIVVIATFDDNEFGVNAGAAHVFERSGDEWRETGLVAPAKPPVAISETAIARLDYLAPDVLVRYYPTSERIRASGFED